MCGFFLISSVCVHRLCTLSGNVVFTQLVYGIPPSCKFLDYRICTAKLYIGIICCHCHGINYAANQYGVIF